MRTIHIALRALIVFTLLTGVVYPLLVTAVGGLCFPRQASGSLVTVKAGRSVRSCRPEIHRSRLLLAAPFSHRLQPPAFRR